MNSFTKKYLELQEENKNPSLAPSIKKASVTTKNTSSSQTKREEEEQQESKNSFTSRYLELSKKREAGEPADYTRLNQRREETPSYLDMARNATEKNIQVTTSGSLEEMQTRLKELEARQRDLTSYMSGAMRGGINAPQTQKFQEEMSANDKEIKRLKSEISAAQSGGMVSELDQMKNRLNELKVQEAQARNKAIQYTGSYAGRAAAAANPEAANAIFNEISSISSEREALEKEIERIEYVNKYQDKAYEDKFTGQFGASYTIGRLNQDRALAWNAYLKNPTDANRKKAEAADELIARFQENNAETLDDDATLPWISQSLANYLPQFIDQAKYSAAGAAIGGAAGSVVPGIGTGFGIKAGIVAGSGAYSFETMRGIAFGDLLAMGVDEETARAAANDEAIISSLIEMADTGVDIASLGVGKLINAITKGGAKAIAGGAAESAVKKLLKALAGYGLNIGGEMMEEGTQQAVTIANQNRVQNGETGGALSLAGDAARVFKNAVTGGNTEDREEIWEAAKEGGKIAAMMGGASAISNNLATAAVENYYGKKMSGYGGETVQAIIEEGLASDEKSESYRQAKVLQQKMENGEEITGREIGRLYEQNVRTINDEEAQAKKSQAAATISKPELTSFEKKLQAATGYGEYGARAFSELMDSENMSMQELRTKFQTAYEAGMTNLPQTAVTLTTNIQKRAFNAGKQDYIMSVSRDMEKARYATVYGDESGFIRTDAARDVAQSTIDLMNEVSRDLGIKSRIEETITGLDGREANASMSGDGILSISKTAEKPLVTMVSHESTHRMQQLAPKEYRAFRDFVVQYTGWYEGRLDTGLMTDTATGAKQAAYSQGGTVSSVDYAMDEVTAEFAEKLFSDEQEMADFIREASRTDESRTAVQKFFDIVKDIVKKLKQTVSRLTRNGRTEEAALVQESIDGMEKARALWLDAYSAAKQAATEKALNSNPAVSEMAASMKEQATEVSDINTQFSLRTKEPPKNTITAYKVFVVFKNRPGELYPPMVASPNGSFTPVGVWLDADTGTPARNKDGSLEMTKSTGRLRVQQGGKGTNKSKSGSLAWRPGWHLGEWPDAIQFAVKNPETGERDLMPENFVFAKCEIAADEDYQLEALEYGVSKKGSFNRTQAGLPYIPYDGYYKYRTNADPDTAPWYITGSMRVVEILDDDMARKECAKHGVVPMTRRGGDIDLSKYGLKAGKVQVTQDLSEYAKIEPQDYSDEVARMPGYVRRALNFDDPTFQKELQIDRVDPEFYRAKYEETHAKQFAETPEIRYGDDKKFSMKDSNYMKAVESGDMETAQKMVDEAAKAAGYTVKGFHGTTQRFYVFDINRTSGNNDLGRGHYFTTSEEEGKYYTSTENPDVITKIESFADDAAYDAGYDYENDYDDYMETYNAAYDQEEQRIKDEGRVIQAYIRMNNPFVISDDTTISLDEAIEIAENAYPPLASDFVYAVKRMSKDGLVKTSDIAGSNMSIYLSKSIMEIGKYDGIIDKTVHDKFGSPSGTNHIIAFESNQIKDASPVTYDDSGKVIPLSERFNDENQDIRFSMKDSEGRGLTAEQQEFFKDSKVLDDDGNLKVMYRGGQSDFTVFDRKKSSYSNLYGRGFYFTDSESHAKQYGSARAFYLNIRNPVSTTDRTITKAQMRKFLKAVAANEDDYSFENYGYDATVDSVLKSVYGKSDFAMLYDVSMTAIGDLVETVELFNKITGSDFDGLILDTETVAFWPEQIKSITNEAPTSNPDIRFSMKETDKLMRENAQLREVVEDLRAQFRTTKFAKVDKKSMDKLTRTLLKDYRSGADINETRDALDSLYTYIANGEDGESPVWSEVFKRAYDAAVSILENVSEVDDELYTQYKGLRDWLRTQPMSINRMYDHDLIGYDSISDFRKANFGRIKITNDGTPVDMVYSELAATYPGFFDESAHVTQPDQLMHIEEVLNRLQPTEFNPYSANMREAATWLANDIIDRFFELPQAKPTYADKAARKLADQKYRDRQKLDRVREQKNERIRQLIAQNREKVKQVQVKERTKRDEAVRQVKEHYKAKEAKASERRQAQLLRAKITRHANDLSAKLLKPTDKQHIPENMRTAVAAVLEAINLESQYTYDLETGKRTKGGDGLPTKRTLAFQKLREQYAEIEGAEGNEMVIDPMMQIMIDRVTEMADVKLADMTVSQLNTIWDVLRVVEHSVNTAGRMLVMDKYARTADWASALVEDTATRRGKKSLTKSHVSIDLEDPYTFFSHYGEAGKSVYRMLRDAQDRQQVMTNKVAEEVSKIVTPKQVKAMEKKIHTFKTVRGDDLILSTAQVMDLYNLTKREQARDHLNEGGIVQPEIDSAKIRRGTDSILLTDLDLANIIKVLSPEEKTIADKLQGLTVSLLSEYGNEASMKAYGYKKFTEKNYWPIKTAREGRNTGVEKGENNTRSIKNIGMAQSTKPHANNPLDISGIFTTFSNHTADMVDYAAWLCPMEDANRMYNFQFRDINGNRTGKTVKGMLDKYGGEKAQDYWFNLMVAIQNGIKAPGDTSVGNVIAKSIGSFKGAAVGGNLRVVIQQPTAFFRANVVLNPVDLSKGLVSGVTKGNGWEKALKYSPIAMRKDMGGFDISNPMKMSEILFDNRTNIRKLNDALSAPAGKADAVTWGKLWNACEWATAREHKDLTAGSDEFYQTVSELFSEVIDQTQVVDGVLQRPQIMRSRNEVIKQATSFMGEPTKALNILIRSYDAFRYEKEPKARSKAMKVLGRSATALVVTAVVNAAAQSIMDALRDDDDEDWKEKFMQAFTGLEGDEESAWDKAISAVLKGNFGGNLNPLTQIPFVKDGLSIIQGYNVSRTDMEIVTDLIEAGKTFIDSVDGQGKRTRKAALAELFSAAAKLYGIPVGNLKRDAWAMLRTFAFETGNIQLQYETDKAIYNLSSTSNKSRFIDILYKAYKEDQDTYEHIYDDLISAGYDADTIKQNMETRMKKDQGVESVSDLEHRYLAPDQQKAYDSKLKELKSNSLWSAASSNDRDTMEDMIFKVVTGDEDTIEAISGGKEYGLDDTEYILYKTAMSMYDQPNANGKYGTYTNKERYDAISAISGLSDFEKAYLWTESSDSTEIYDALGKGINIDVYMEFKGDVDSISADKDSNGKSISGSRKEKIIDYLNAHVGNEKEYWYLLGLEYPSEQKNARYKYFFG